MRVVTGLLVLGLVACNGDAPEDQAPNYPPPTIRIVSPADGAEVAGEEVEVEVEVTDFVFQPPEAAASLPVLPLWGRLFLTEAAAHEPGQEPEGFVQVRLDGQEVAEVADTRAALEIVKPGSYTLEVELLWPDRDSFYPPVVDSIVFTYVGE